MPVTFLQPSPQVVELTRTKLQDMAQQKQFHIAPLAAAESSQITLTSPHAIYNIGLEDILDNKPLSAARFTGWRFIVRSNSPDPAAAEMLSDSPTGTPTFSSVNDGPFVAGTVATLQALAADPAFAKGDWEARMIRIPALYIMAIWAHDKKSKEDLIRVVPPVPPFLDPKRSYNWAQFKAAIEQPARQKLSFDDSPKP